jgi:emfourin
MTRVELVRSGGFAGLSLRAEVDTAAVDDPDAAWVDEALAGVDVDALAAGVTTPGGPGAPDRFTYRLAVDRDGRRSELTFGERAVPEPLRPVVDRLVARARSGASPDVGAADT